VPIDESPAGYTPLIWPGFCTLIGPLFARSAGEDIVIGLRIDSRHANSSGYAHGGLIATLADIALTHAVLRRSGPEFLIVTVSLNLDYAGAAHPADWIEINTTVTKSEGSLAFAHCDLRVEGRPIAHASGVLKKLRRERAG
jgi:acyl-coenzyme A thioesterase 13